MTITEKYSFLTHYVYVCVCMCVCYACVEGEVVWGYVQKRKRIKEGLGFKLFV